MRRPRAETGWRATGSECVARRITNPFRRDGAASLRLEGEALRDAQAEMAVKAMSVPIKWLGAGCAEGKTEARRSKRRDLCGRVSRRGVRARIGAIGVAA